MHPWHEVELYKDSPAIIPAIIEVPKGSQIKYELDKKSGLVKVVCFQENLSSTIICV